MRWLVPWFLLLLLPVTLVIADEHWIYRLALWAQLGFYGLALAGWFAPRLRHSVAVRIPFYFMQVNAALFLAGVDFLRGKRVVTWEPSKR